MTIDVSPELTEAIAEAAQASDRLRQAAASSDRTELGRAQKEWLAAQERRRGGWRAMATPVPTTTKE